MWFHKVRKRIVYIILILIATILYWTLCDKAVLLFMAKQHILRRSGWPRNMLLSKTAFRLCTLFIVKDNQVDDTTLLLLALFNLSNNHTFIYLSCRIFSFLNHSSGPLFFLYFKHLKSHLYIDKFVLKISYCHNCIEWVCFPDKIIYIMYIYIIYFLTT